MAIGAGRRSAACRRYLAISAARRRCGARWRAAGRLGIPYLTLFAFSSENWRRPTEEVEELMNLLRFYIRRELNELAKNGVQLRFLGEIDDMAPDIVDLLQMALPRKPATTAR